MCKKDGFDTLVIVLIVIGVLAVAGASNQLYILSFRLHKVCKEEEIALVLVIRRTLINVQKLLNKP